MNQRQCARNRRMAYNCIEESRFANVREANDAGSEAHAYLRGRREGPP